jgi:hypothetical protein
MKHCHNMSVTFLDNNMKLLKNKPRRWEEIQNGQFMIINGQHNITTSKELQHNGCGEAQQIDMRTWDTYIVWTLDPLQLHYISKFYNFINHLNHAQLTWENKIINSRVIRDHLKRPTLIADKAQARKNGA